jgi:hypothetical protein
MSNRHAHSPQPLSAVKAGNKPFPAVLTAGGRRVMGSVRAAGSSSSSATKLAAFFLARRSEADFSGFGTRNAASPANSNH